MLKFLCSNGLRAIAVMACLCSAAIADDVPPSKAAPRSVPSADKRIQESMTVDTATLFGFTQADVEKASAEKLAKYLGPEVLSVSAAAQPTPDSFGEYIIDSGDLLEFISFDDETLNREITVRYDGHVSLPRVADLQLAGLTRPAAQDAIRKAYSEIYKEPEISLSIVTPSSKAYVVTGDVETPGRYPFERTVSLWDAINLAGGLRQRNSSGGGGGSVGITGQITKAFVIRRVNGERQVLPFDLRGLGKPGDYQGDTPITYGDVVYIPRKTLVRLQEFVDRSAGSVSQILGLYTQALDARYALDLSRGTLDALQNAANVAVVR